MTTRAHSIRIDLFLLGLCMGAAALCVLVFALG